MAEERVVNGSKTGGYDLHLDRIENKWAQYLPGVDYAIISSAHWFFRPIYLHEDGNVIGCVYCDAKNISHVQPSFAVPRVFRTALKYINDCKECGRLLTFVRTFSPSHFENGAWNTGGRCNRTSPYTGKQINLGSSEEWDLKIAQLEEIERLKKNGVNKGKRFEALDVTKAMMMRPDGHPDIHWNNQYMQGYSDCVHWCLPGPIDVWNDLLMAVFRKQDYSSLV
ncbi:trichome birefringence-like [Thalictrum thalictroides]|uniref:Trichome birefringence-like n=1 Tax=Thalictrum thalictroides TaxID=46969 RepID=A0A7J6WVZ6_THATH|nr:trichome birefringence-like [Thalictrum thalictroides]